MAPIADIAIQAGVSHHMYADDNQLYVSFNPYKESTLVLDNIQTCIMSIKAWMQSNMLKLNDSKTEYIVFGSPHFMRQLTIPNLQVGTSVIESSDKVKNLGATFDSCLTMENFVLDKVRSSLFYLKNIKRIRPCLTQETAKTLVHAFVITRLDYANSLLYGIRSDLVKKLQVVQNYAARLIYQTSRYHSALPLFKTLHWLPVETRVTFKILVLVHKCLIGQGPSYLTDLLQWKKPTRNLRSYDCKLLENSRSVNSFGDRAFYICAPKLWNKLPFCIRNIEDHKQFKKDLKTHFCGDYYTD